MSVQWLDISHRSLPECVRELFALTSATEYAVSVDDFLAQGWRGEGCKFPIGSTPQDGLVLIHADPYCPPGALFALPGKKDDPMRVELREIRQQAADLLLHIDHVLG